MCNQCTAFLSVHNYMLDLVLPKCNIVFGNKFSSVYIQLLLNINNDPKEVSWKKNKCWMGPKTIANNINGNERKVKSMLKSMEDIGLIEKTYRGKLFMFSLKDHKISDINKIYEFNQQLENKLLNIVTEKNKLNTLKKFNIINNVFKYNSNYHYNNLVELKYWVTISEKIQCGSSLMFLMLFADSFLKPTTFNSTLENISEKEIAMKLGISQSTVSRYLKSFQDKECFKLEYEKTKKNSKILINKELLSMEKDIIETNIETEIFKCPICNKDVSSIKKLNSHIKRCKDDLHVLFQDMQEQNQAFTMNEIINLYNDNKDQFTSIVEKKEEGKKKLNSNAVQLLKYYYSLTNTRCPSWPKETNLIKSHLMHGMEPDEIMEVMRYMARRSYQDLRFFNNSINDALTIRQCKIDVKNEGTDAYLVKLYFSKMGQTINDRLMLQAIKKINELKSSNYTYDQIKTIVEYMIEKRCPSFNFIVNMANEALKNAKDRNEMAKAYTTDELVNVTLDGILEYGIIMMKDCDYDMAKKDIILRLKEDLCAGKVDLTKVNKTYNKFAIALAKEIYRRSLYDINLTPQQWINKIHLNVVNIE